MNKYTHLAIFNNIIEEFSTGNIFHNHENIRWCADDLIPIKQAKMFEFKHYSLYIKHSKQDLYMINKSYHFRRHIYIY